MGTITDWKAYMWTWVGALVAIGLVIGMLSTLVRWWTEGSLGCLDGLLIAAVCGALIIGVFSARSLAQLLLALIPATGVAVYIGYWCRAGSINAFYQERMRECSFVIQQDPKNYGAREALAELLQKSGDLEQAVQEIQAAVDLGAGPESGYKLNKWQSQLAAQASANPVCRWCDTVNVVGGRICSNCGFDLPYDNSVTRFLMGQRNATARYIVIWLVALSLAYVSCVVLPYRYALVPIGCGALAAWGWALVKSARS